MPGAITVRTSGFRELERSLAELPNRTRKAVLTRALRRASPVVVAAAKSNAPRGLTGHLAASPGAGTKLTARQAAQSRGGVKSTAEINIGIMADGSTGVTNYAALTEYYNPGSAGWFTRAWEATKGQALDSIKIELTAAIGKSRRRAGLDG